MGAVSEQDVALSKKIREAIEAAGLNPNAVAKKAGIDNANFYRLLRNERKWSFQHLEKVCTVLGLSFKELFGEPLHIPIVSTITALEPFPYPNKINGLYVANVHINYYGKQEEKKMDLYSIEVGDRSFLPAFSAGTRFVVEKNSSEDIKDETLVVCPDEKGGAYVCRVHIGDTHIVLRSLNPTVPERILPKTHLKLCERVVLIYPA